MAFLSAGLVPAECPGLDSDRRLGEDDHMAKNCEPYDEVTSQAFGEQAAETSPTATSPPARLRRSSLTVRALAAERR
jgi:hypothetical protein